MKFRFYVDIHSFTKETDAIYCWANSAGSVKSEGSTRYAFDIEIPDPMKPDVSLGTIHPEEEKSNEAA